MWLLAGARRPGRAQTRLTGFFRRRKIGGGPAVFPPSPRLTYQPACKPGSVWPAARTADVTAIPLVRRLPGASCNLPERLARTDPAPAPTSFLFGLAPGGVCRAVSVAGNAVRSYRTVSPLPRPKRYAAAAVCSLWHCPWGLAPKGSTPPDVIRHRSSMEPGLSSPAAFRHWRGAAVRPTDGIGWGPPALPSSQAGYHGAGKKARTCRGGGQARAWGQAD